jgi:glucosylglycerate synthase
MSEDASADATGPGRPSGVATEPAPGAALDEQLVRIGSADIAVCLLTYNQAATAPAVAEVAKAALAQHVPGASAVLINADAGSSDRTPELLGAVGLPTVLARHNAPLTERAAVPFHGVPGRGSALHLVLEAVQRLKARAALILEADVSTVTPEWIERMVRPIWDEKADFVLPAYARHRYDGTITNLLLAPLVRALYGRRLRQPLPGSQAFSARLVDHLLANPRWRWSGRDVTDLWVVGTAIVDGFGVWEAWLGPRRIASRTRSADLPTMVAQTLGAVFTVMDRHSDLWLEVRGSEPVPAVGQPVLPAIEPMAVDVERMMAAFRQGLRDLAPLWEDILAPDTFGEVLGVEGSDTGRLRFPNDLWARVVYDFALAHHYGVVHREHLLRSLVPLYLGRTADFVLTTGSRDAAGTEATLEAVAVAFERQKPYLVARWR